jgi:S1-C subfamily serine protease
MPTPARPSQTLFSKSSPKAKPKGKGSPKKKKKKAKSKGKNPNKAWFGFVVRNQKGQNNLLIKDVADRGPAEKAGLMDNDLLVSVGKTKTPNLDAFRSLLARVKPGKKMKLVYIRGATKHTTKIKVDRKAKPLFPDLPSLSSYDDLQTILLDQSKLQMVSDFLFYEADTNLCGFISRPEYLDVMKRILSKHLSDEELHGIFDKNDSDKSNYLTLREFEGVTRSVLELEISHLREAMGRPWIGFGVTKGPQGGAIFVTDIVRGGPAETAGILEGDELVAFSGVQTPNNHIFRSLVKKLVVGQVVRVDVLRFDNYGGSSYKTLELVVGALKDLRLELPQLTSRELEKILCDSSKLRMISDSAFMFADKDLSGSIDHSEFQDSVRSWLSSWTGRWLSDMISPSELESLYANVDVDGSGFLVRNEFLPVVEGLLKVIHAALAAAESATEQFKSTSKLAWLGLEVRSLPGRPNVFVAEIAPSGPADRGGLIEGDEVASIAEVPTPDPHSFRAVLAQLSVGQVVRIEVIRVSRGFEENQKFTVVVGSRKKKTIGNVPPHKTLPDLEAVLADSYKLERISAFVFNEADTDASGFIDANEFTRAIRKTVELPKSLSDADLSTLFSIADSNNSGFVSNNEFRPVIEGAIRLAIAHLKGVSLTVQEVLFLLTHSIPPKSGSPWVGFEVKPHNGHLYVQEVVEDGPADQSGLLEGDQLVALAGYELRDVTSFRELVKHLQVGESITASLNRSGSHILANITVGARKKKKLSNVPPIDTIQNIESVLKDSFKLEIVALDFFNDADSDFSGLIDVNEFKAVLRERLNRSPSIPSKDLKDSDIEAIFQLYDGDNSGFLKKTEIVKVVEGYLKLLVGYHNKTIKNVHQLISILTGSATPKVGSPWLGFEVKQSSGKSTLLVVEVIEDGPADKVGLRYGDELISVDGVQTSSLDGFRAATKNLQVNQSVSLMLLRGRLDLIVGARRRIDVEGLLYPMNTVEELVAILKDTFKLDKVSTALFAAADTDFSGVVDRKEFRLGQLS